jgi:hypothetical protein
MTHKINTKELIGKLAAHPENDMELETLLSIVAHMINPPKASVPPEPEWIGLNRIRKMTISAPAAKYAPFDAKGKATIVRDYFRIIEQAEPGDEVLVEVQTGLGPVSLQKNICSLLSTTKNPKFTHFKTSRTSEGVVVSFS